MFNPATFDRRHAILIAIDDYVENPLDYCVSDALSVKEALIKYCLFKEEDIHLITSASGAHFSEIFTRFTTAVEAIRKEFVPNQSSVFFYFAGHGEAHFDESSLAFHEILIPIQSIFCPLNDLKPKFLTHVIDACESGSKVNTRGPIPLPPARAQNLEQFIHSSAGYVFMLACKSHQKAKEVSHLGHGLFTYQLLSCLESPENYDELGILDPDKISSFIKRRTSAESKFKQIPVVEVRSSGYYPFALIGAAQMATSQKSKGGLPNTSAPGNIEQNKMSAIIIDKFPTIDPGIRKSVFQALNPALLNVLNSYAASYSKSTSYSISYSLDLHHLPAEILEEVHEKIILNSKHLGIEAAGKIFSTNLEPLRQANISAFGYLNFLLAGPRPSPRPVYTINFGSDDIISGSFHLTSNSVKTTECGFGFIIYQAIYGIGFAPFTYKMDWNGFAHRTPIGPSIEYSAILYKEDTISTIPERVRSLCADFEKKVEKWNKGRQKEIDDFRRRAR